MLWHVEVGRANFFLSQPVHRLRNFFLGRHLLHQIILKGSGWIGLSKNQPELDQFSKIARTVGQILGPIHLQWPLEFLPMVEHAEKTRDKQGLGNHQKHPRDYVDKIGDMSRHRHPDKNKNYVDTRLCTTYSTMSPKSVSFTLSWTHYAWQGQRVQCCDSVGNTKTTPVSCQCHNTGMTLRQH